MRTRHFCVLTTAESKSKISSVKCIEEVVLAAVRPEAVILFVVDSQYILLP